MATLDETADALDELRGGNGVPFNTMLNAMIRTRGVKNMHMRDDVRSDVLEFVSKQIHDGLPSDQIAPQIWNVVRNTAADAFRQKTAVLKRMDDDPDESDRHLITPSAEEECEMYERYIALEAALKAMRGSGKHADRRQFAALDASMNGQSPRERLTVEFGEDLTDDTAAHVVLRAREKLRGLCGIPKSPKKS